MVNRADMVRVDTAAALVRDDRQSVADRWRTARLELR
jgi:hypothetical protein